MLDNIFLIIFALGIVVVLFSLGVALKNPHNE